MFWRIICDIGSYLCFQELFLIFNGDENVSYTIKYGWKKEARLLRSIQASVESKIKSEKPWRKEQTHTATDWGLNGSLSAGSERILLGFT